MERLLLHSCCGPCSSAVIERLIKDYDVTVFYFNPNITDEPEYVHRRDEQRRLIEEAYPDVKFIEGKYDPAEFYLAASGLEGEPEGGRRCEKCFILRLKETARLAAEQCYDCFDTTLTVSPHKNYEVISAVGRQMEALYGVKYLSGNYKKQNGYMRSVELSRQYSLYRQNYCGCEFSKWFDK